MVASQTNFRRSAPLAFFYGQQSNIPKGEMLRLFNSLSPLQKGVKEQMPKNDFFKEEEKIETPSTIKLGEEEYSQDQLQELVGLGKLGKEMEEKWQTKIDKVWPDYTAKSQKLKQLEEEAEGLRKFKQDKEAEAKKVLDSKPEDQLTPEEYQAKVKEEAKRLGFVTKEDFRQYYSQERAAERLLDEAQSLVEEVKKDGKPAVTMEELLNHMKETGIPRVETAYKDLKEEDLDRWKESQLGKIKKTGMVTQEDSHAGSDKKPLPKEIKTQADLNRALAEHFAQE